MLLRTILSVFPPMKPPSYLPCGFLSIYGAERRFPALVTLSGKEIRSMIAIWTTKAFMPMLNGSTALRRRVAFGMRTLTIKASRYFIVAIGPTS